MAPLDINALLEEEIKKDGSPSDEASMSRAKSILNEFAPQPGGVSGSFAPYGEVQSEKIENAKWLADRIVNIPSSIRL